MACSPVQQQAQFPLPTVICQQLGYRDTLLHVIQASGTQFVLILVSPARLEIFVRVWPGDYFNTVLLTAWYRHVYIDNYIVQLEVGREQIGQGMPTTYLL